MNKDDNINMHFVSFLIPPTLLSDYLTKCVIVISVTTNIICYLVTNCSMHFEAFYWCLSHFYIHKCRQYSMYCDQALMSYQWVSAKSGCCCEPGCKSTTKDDRAR